MKKIIFTMTIAWLVVIQYTIAQSFSLQGVSPFGIKLIKDNGTRSAQKIVFYDYDQDGDQDLLLSGIEQTLGFETWDDFIFFMEIQYNIGDSENPQYGDREALFDEFPFPRGYFTAAVGDLNQDGKADFISGAEIDYIGNQTFSYLMGTGTQGNEFEATPLSLFELTPFAPLSGRAPELTDIDLDGDLDLFFSGFDTDYTEGPGPNIPITYYAKNTGDASTPQFEGWYFQPYGFESDTTIEINTLGDIDNDGDIDVLGAGTNIPADSLNHLFVHLNLPGGDGKPHFEAEALLSPFGLPTTFGESQMISPDLVDIDDDGDLDLFVIVPNGQSLELRYYENDLCQPTTTSFFTTICEGDTYVDWGQSFTQAGNYQIPLISSIGCDSLIDFTLEVEPLPQRQVNASICSGETYVIAGQSFSSPGNYMVFVPNVNGCDTLVLLTLIVNVTDAVSINDHICDGDTLTIGTDIFTESGQYEVHLKNQFACDSIVFLNLVVVHLDAEVVVNENILTSTQAFAEYQWFNCDTGEDIPGATEQSYEVTQTGNYAVQVGSNDCEVQSSCQFVMISSLDPVSNEHAVQVYPNPSNGIVFIKNLTGDPIYKVEVWTVDGTGLLLQTKDSSIDLSVLPAGVYMIKSFIDQSIFVNRIVRL